MTWLEPLTWDWGALINTMLGAGVSTAIVQSLAPILRDRRQHKSHAAYMAMRLAVILESYASACLEFIDENSQAEMEWSRDEQFPNWNATLPEPSSYPEDAEGWRAIDRRLAGQCLNLRNKIKGSQNAISSVIDNNMDELGGFLKERAARLGLKAWSLAIEMRRKHGVEQADADWDYGENFERIISCYDKAEVDRRKSNVEILHGLP